jgi:hypothetical protein
MALLTTGNIIGKGCFGLALAAGSMEFAGVEARMIKESGNKNDVQDQVMEDLENFNQENFNQENRDEFHDTSPTQFDSSPTHKEMAPISQNLKTISGVSGVTMKTDDTDGPSPLLRQLQEEGHKTQKEIFNEPFVLSQEKMPQEKGPEMYTEKGAATVYVDNLLKNKLSNHLKLKSRSLSGPQKQTQEEKEKQHSEGTDKKEKEVLTTSNKDNLPNTSLTTMIAKNNLKLPRWEILGTDEFNARYPNVEKSKTFTSKIQGKWVEEEGENGETQRKWVGDKLDHTDYLITDVFSQLPENNGGSRVRRGWALPGQEQTKESLRKQSKFIEGFESLRDCIRQVNTTV